MFHTLSTPHFRIYNVLHHLTRIFNKTTRFYSLQVLNNELDLEKSQNSHQTFDFSLQELNSLPRRRLQQLAKNYKIRANASNDYIRQELARHYCNNANKLMYEESQFTKTMSNEQLGVLKYALQGESFFFSGSAGTGKSYLLREIVRQLKNKHGQDKVYVTSSTGVAACNVGGCTLHSFAGIGIGALDFEQLEESVKKKRYVVERWKRAQVLIVDEVSMLDGDTFEKIEFLARKIRKSELPFGGLQVIFCGDFLQLPPVAPRGSDVRFAFESEAWNRVVKKTFVLHQPFRQKNPEFVKVLNEIRVGKVTSDGIELLKTCADREFPDTEIKPTKLYPHRHAVQIENNKNLQELKGELRVYTATDSGEEPFLSQIKRHCCAPQVLEIKKDAQVILLKNLDIENKLVNGSRGVVIGFDFNGYPIVKFSTGTIRAITPEIFSIYCGELEVASRVQVPLALAWALSIHKSQGMTIDKMQTALNNVFEYGQTYVSLSRCVSLEGLSILNFSPNNLQVKAHPRVIRYYETLEESKL